MKFIKFLANIVHDHRSVLIWRHRNALCISGLWMTTLTSYLHMIAMVKAT